MLKIDTKYLYAQSTRRVREPLEDDPYSTVTPISNTSSNSSTIDFGLFSFLFFFLLIIIVGIAGFTYWYSRERKKEDYKKKSKDGVFLLVRVPRGNDYEIGLAEKMFSNLHSIGTEKKGWKGWFSSAYSISFEIVAIPGEISFYIYTPKKLKNLIEQQVIGSYQSVDIREVEEVSIFHEDGFVGATELTLSEKTFYPIKTYESFKGDPLANILSVMEKLGHNEGCMVQVVIGAASSKWQKDGRKFLNSVESNNSDPEKKRIQLSSEQSQGISSKISKNGFHTSIRLIACSSKQEYADMLVDNMVSAFDQFSNPGVNEFKKVDDKKLWKDDFIDAVIYRRLKMNRSKTSILNVQELSTIMHMPNKETIIPNINWLLARDLPAASWISSDTESKDTIWIGDNVYRGTRKRICFQREDRRRHCFILGQTGSGKSMLMLRMLYQDIMNGDGVCYIDPHGTDAQKLLGAIPPERVEDVIYFNAADFERPIGFNIIEFENEQDKHMIINRFLDLLKKLYDPHNQGIVGPILERAFRNAMLTGMSEKGTTLVEILRIMTDEDWVKSKWLPLIEDDLVRRYWTDQIAKTSDYHKSETLGYLSSKFDRFVTNLALRHIIGQAYSSFNIRKSMDEGKIIIVNLAKGLVGEMNAQFLGILLIPKILSAALSREDIPESQRRDFFLYVDEFQNFATPEFVSILSEARKYRLNLTLGTQFIAQIQEDIRNAVFGNVGSMLIARTGPDDSKLLESHFAPTLTATDLSNQPNIHYYAKMLTGGRHPDAFSLNTGFGPKFPEVGFDLPYNQEIADLVVQISRLRYGRDVNLVRAEIDSRSNADKKSTIESKDPFGLPQI